MASPAAPPLVRSDYGPYMVVPASKSARHYGPFRTLQAAGTWGEAWFDEFTILPLTKPFKRPDVRHTN